jgi:hypothetical protein
VGMGGRGAGGRRGDSKGREGWRGLQKKGWSARGEGGAQGEEGRGRGGGRGHKGGGGGDAQGKRGGVADW